MKWRGTQLIVLLFLVFTLAGFVTAFAWQPGGGGGQRTGDVSDPLRALGGWLRLMPDQVAEIEKVDPTFAAERDEMEATLAAERERLASMFENATASDEQILAQVDKVIEVHDTLERRVAAYLLALRPHLTPGQRAKLFERCGSEVREAGGRRWRGPPAGRGPGATRGNGGGRGPGRGRGMGPPWAESGDRSSNGRGRSDR